MVPGALCVPFVGREVHQEPCKTQRTNNIVRGAVL